MALYKGFIPTFVRLCPWNIVVSFSSVDYQSISLFFHHFPVHPGMTIVMLTDILTAPNYLNGLSNFLSTFYVQILKFFLAV